MVNFHSSLPKSVADVIVNVQHSDGSTLPISVGDLYAFKQDPEVRVTRERINQRVEVLSKNCRSATKVGLIASLICVITTAATFYFFGNSPLQKFFILGLGTSLTISSGIIFACLQADSNHEKEKKIQEEEWFLQTSCQGMRNKFSPLRKVHSCNF